MVLGLFRKRRRGTARTGEAKRIALLTSTRPLRFTVTRRNRTKEKFNVQAAMDLAARFDLILVGSTASDAVYEYISKHLTASARDKFRFYGRGYFETYAGRSILGASRDERNDGWKAILRENGITHELTAKVLGDDFEYHTKPFNWQEIGDFVTDPRVSLVSGDNGQLFYDRPRAVTAGQF